ncbi:MAG TPA: hypothetical protein PLY85_08320 [Anaerolineaceae bacterium]|jgi:hypothetical protein|nr:hypothetical protein [Anaerolineaceae bacterium]
MINPTKFIKFQQFINNTKFEWVCLGTLVLILIFFGLQLYDDYGLHWDSIAQLEIGRENITYVRERNESFYEFDNRYYGPIYEMFLFTVTEGLSEQQVFFTRHLLTYFLFVAGVIAFYFLVKRILKNWLIALIGCIMLVASPRIFGDAFYNSKDIPFMVIFIFTGLSLHLYLEKKNLGFLALHSLMTAILIAIRAPGIVMIGLTGILFLYLILFSHDLSWKKGLIHGLLYLAATALLLYLFWPILWHDPFHEIVKAFETMAHYPWLGGVLLYRGAFIEAVNLPWHYIPFWMLITIPLGYTYFVLVGVFELAVNLIESRSIKSLLSGRDLLLVSGWLIVPVLAVILLKSVLYDAWRQMFFIYPAFIIFALIGLKGITSIRWGKLTNAFRNGIIAIVLVIAITEPVIFIIKNHPVEMVYFNELPYARSEKLRPVYEMEYWGISYRQGLDYILEQNPVGQITLKIANSPGRLNSKLFSQDDRERLIFVANIEDADYYMTNYRFHPEDYPYQDEVFSIRIRNDTIFSVFRIAGSGE